jgi:hypothetical protein
MVGIVADIIIAPQNGLYPTHIFIHLIFTQYSHNIHTVFTILKCYLLHTIDHDNVCPHTGGPHQSQLPDGCPGIGPHTTGVQLWGGHAASVCGA